MVGVVAPPGTNTDPVIVATKGLLLVSVTVVPPGGAAGESVTANATGWFGAIVTFEPRPKAPPADTFATTEAGATFGAFPVALIVEDPSAAPVTGTLTVVADG